ncbi:MAG TPA: hypothetical protein VHC90_01925 [Bryobacteraceae bacterium]|nr:hypothetical protein [Bryobacteraceae bacterium]
MKLIKALIVIFISAAILVCLLLGAVLWRGYQISTISETVARNHLVEKGNGAAWPVKITGLLGEVTTTSDSVRKSAEATNKLLADQGAKTATALQNTAASLSQVADKISSLSDQEGPDTAKSVRDAAAGIAGTSRTLQSILTKDGPATAKSVRDAAASIASAAAAVSQEAPETAQSVRDAAGTAEKILNEEGPPTAAALRKALENSDEISGSWADISNDVDTWVKRLTAPPTFKQAVSAWIHTLIIALSHLL